VRNGGLLPTMNEGWRPVGYHASLEAEPPAPVKLQMIQLSFSQNLTAISGKTQSQKTIQLSHSWILDSGDLSIHKAVNMIHYINEMKYKYHIIILIDDQ